ncbi:MAG: hypothetical protein JSR60_07400 [Proteobacteria bacterium]|nr:hypothetical protein [Pseudomonadota bacterium]
MNERNSGAGAAALLILGLVVLIPSGLCTGFLGIGALADAVVHPANLGGSMSVLAMALVVGGPFVALGAVMVWIAVRRMRR